MSFVGYWSHYDQPAQLHVELALPATADADELVRFAADVLVIRGPYTPRNQGGALFHTGVQSLQLPVAAA